MVLLNRFAEDNLLECGCDEAGRGCLAGPVYAAAVILPDDFSHPWLNDSKQLTEAKRYALREEIERQAIAWSIGVCTAEEIDCLNILRASHLAMHRAIAGLSITPKRLLIDGNRFTPYRDLTSVCIIKGDAKYTSIAAASILAKTYRDDEMKKLHDLYPYYGWYEHKGYPTKKHREAIAKHGASPLHRKTFKLL